VSQLHVKCGGKEMVNSNSVRGGLRGKRVLLSARRVPGNRIRLAKKGKVLSPTNKGHSTKPSSGKSRFSVNSVTGDNFPANSAETEKKRGRRQRQ